MGVMYKESSLDQNETLITTTIIQSVRLATLPANTSPLRPSIILCQLAHRNILSTTRYRSDTALLTPLQTTIMDSYSYCQKKISRTSPLTSTHGLFYLSAKLIGDSMNT